MQATVFNSDTATLQEIDEALFHAQLVSSEQRGSAWHAYVDRLLELRNNQRHPDYEAPPDAEMYPDAVVVSMYFTCDTSIGDGAHVLYMLIKRHINDKDGLQDCRQTLAKELGVSQRTLTRYYAELQRAGWIFRGPTNRAQKGAQQ